MTIFFIVALLCAVAKTQQINLSLSCWYPSFENGTAWQNAVMTYTNTYGVTVIAPPFNDINVLIVDGVRRVDDLFTNFTPGYNPFFFVIKNADVVNWTLTNPVISLFSNVNFVLNTQPDSEMCAIKYGPNCGAIPGYNANISVTVPNFCRLEDFCAGPSICSVVNGCTQLNQTPCPNQTCSPAPPICLPLTSAPTTGTPSLAPTTSAPTTGTPSLAPTTLAPTSAAPTPSPTIVTGAPTSSTNAPTTTPAPTTIITGAPTTITGVPTSSPTSGAPTQPVTGAPTTTPGSPTAIPTASNAPTPSTTGFPTTPTISNAPTNVAPTSDTGSSVVLGIAIGLPVLIGLLMLCIFCIVPWASRRRNDRYYIGDR